MAATAVTKTLRVTHRGVEKLIRRVIFDFTGTLSVDGVPTDGILELLEALANEVEVIVATADTHGKVYEALAPVPSVTIKKVDEGWEKVALVKEIGAKHVAVVGNGFNDTFMFEAVGEEGIRIAVLEGEGVWSELLTMPGGAILVKSSCDAINPLLKLKRMHATTRD